MVLGELGTALASALKKLGEHTVVDEEIMEACLKEVTRALLQADVNVQYVVKMKARSVHWFPHDSFRVVNADP